jgi:hypothetical protein
MKALKSYISGDGFGIPKVLDEPLFLRRFQRTFSSLYYIFPDERFWPDDKVNLFFPFFVEKITKNLILGI